MNISIFTENKSKVCLEVLTKLPEWFTLPEAIQDYSNGVKDSTMFIARENDTMIGFISLKQHFSTSYEVYVMGVLSKYHHKGIGTELLTHAEKYLKSNGAKYLTVKTLSESRTDKYYDLTRSFYYKNNFIPIEEFKELWDKDNPCLFMVKNLN